MMLKVRLNEISRRVMAHVVASRASMRVAHRFFSRLQGSGRRLMEKTPRNCFLVSFLRGLYPDARFIHIRGDGPDVAAS